MTTECKKSEKSIDNLLFSSDDESDFFTNDFATKNIAQNIQAVTSQHDDFDDLKNLVGHTSKSKRVYSYDINILNNNDDDDLINCRDQFSKFFNLN